MEGIMQESRISILGITINRYMFITRHIIRDPQRFTLVTVISCITASRHIIGRRPIITMGIV